MTAQFDLQERRAALGEAIERCMLCDQSRLRRALRDVFHGREADKARLATISEQIDRSIDRRERRARDLPRPTFDQDLPVIDRRLEIAEAIRDNQVVIVCGETGSGKSTQLPKICLDVGLGVKGMIGHTQPRRIAARSIAARIADELGSPLGKHVGYTVRFTDRTPEDAYIKVMTDGILLAETARDRLLRRYDTLIIDEAHERSLNIDFLLGYLKQILGKRQGLRVVITSATIDPQRFSAHFGDAPILEVSGRTYPVDVRYRPLESDDPEEGDLTLQEGVVAAVRELSAEGPGDILIFMPGEREIRKTAETLRKQRIDATEIVPLYARLSAKEQNRIFKDHDGRRIVIATNVAETSLTVPGIRYVIDPGLARMSRYNARSGVQGLPIEAISQASANQRAGRCGRVEAGVCLRLYSQREFEGREAFTTPEVLRTNLASVILQMKALGLGEARRFPFLESPRSRMLEDGERTLRELNAIDDRGRLTKIGRQLSRLPVDPRIGRMVIAAGRLGSLAEVLKIASALAVQDPRERPLDQADAADEAHRAFDDKRSDFLWYLNFWKAYHEQKSLLSQNQLRKWCRERFVSFMRVREWIDTHRQLRMLAEQADLPFNHKPASYASVHKALLSGLLSNVGRRSEKFAFQGAHGRSFYIFPGSVRFEDPPKWSMAAEIVQTQRLYARTVAEIQPRWIEQAASHLVDRSYRDPYWDQRTAQVKALETVRLYGVELVKNRPVHYGPINPGEARRIFIEHALVMGAYHTDAPFFDHNLSLLTQIEHLEAKTRRRDLLADASMRFGFYDAIVPGEVYSGRHFEQWRKNAEASKPRLLFMTEEDIVAKPIASGLGEGFPDRTEFGDFAIEYLFDPASNADGVTVRIPIQKVGRVKWREFEWLVPGLRAEKAEAMIRTLPKSLRRDLQPAAEFGRAAVEGVGPADGPIAEVVASRLNRLGGVPVKAADFRMEDLPSHLRMSMHVVDETGHTIIRSRSVEEVLHAIGDRGAEPIASSKWTRDNLDDWDFGDLPEHVETDGGEGMPALVDIDGAACLRVFSSKELALRAMRSGIRRLFHTCAKRELESAYDYEPRRMPLELTYAPFGGSAALRDHLSLVTVDRVFMGGWETIRSSESFQAALERGRRDVAWAMSDAAVLLETIITAQHRVFVLLSQPFPQAWEDAIEDMRRQLDDLTPTDFAIKVPLEQLEQLPRYLNGIETRLGRLKHGGHRKDGAQMIHIAEIVDRIRGMREQMRSRGMVNDDLEACFWSLQELRLNLFVPGATVRERVSVKRIGERLDSIEVY